MQFVHIRAQVNLSLQKFPKIVDTPYEVAYTRKFPKMNKHFQIGQFAQHAHY